MLVSGSVFLIAELAVVIFDYLRSDTKSLKPESS